MTAKEIVLYVYHNNWLFPLAVAILIPFIIIAVGLAINLLGEALATLLSFFTGEWFAFVLVNYVFFPGVMLHELSHALMAVLTGARVTELALFKREGNSLGHVNYVGRGNAVMLALQCLLTSSAPMYIGGLIVYLCWHFGFEVKGVDLWLKILLGYIGVSMFYHMTMSTEDIKVYVKGIPLFMGILFVLSIALRLFGVV
jgi:hypothetical protein